ncbi:MAG: 5-methyltetrahydropteroyltriglutamate--homocysteine S-methyltransferase [Candidatus Bostrichicola ureolyticus]|nr:MAG: 5-methyltetrahydropteroyltriglutamate--homocysteine S-methyltransferase [Candidatus Bostrichicola ureolyticus]
MLKHNLGYPRFGIKRQLKKYSEKYWEGKIEKEVLFKVAKELRYEHWKIQEFYGLDLIPCNDFSFYDHVLDMSFLLGVIPERYDPLWNASNNNIDLYFAMARGYQKDNLDITAMEMTKWFDTNYHYMVPEFTYNQKFNIFSTKIFDEFAEAKQYLSKEPKPVLIGPISYLLLGKEKESNFHRIDLIKNLIPIYVDILIKLKNDGAKWIQLDEPFLIFDLSEKEKKAFIYAYEEISKQCEGLNILLTTYFEDISHNMSLIFDLPIKALHIDLIKSPDQLNFFIKKFPEKYMLSLGIIDGRNIWKNNYIKSVEKIKKSIDILGDDRIMIAPNCSLMHIPFDINIENDIPIEIKEIIAFAKQKLEEIDHLYQIINGNNNLLENNKKLWKHYNFINNLEVKKRVDSVKDEDMNRKNPFNIRKILQNKNLKLPLFPTTTIGSFPQTLELRQIRLKFKKGLLTKEEYNNYIEKNIINVIKCQEEIGLDVLVHGEFERNDMVEYFSEYLNGFISTKNGWVQSYGSRYVKPPIIYGDVFRKQNITVDWSQLAQSHTKKPIKGMLTGPITILQWSFVRDDQKREITAQQIALAIRDEVEALEKAGIKIIQIDEPAIREGLPLKKKDWNYYLNWAIKAFKISSCCVKDETQIHTHMCYSEFNDIIDYIVKMDVDVITIETSRSKLKLLKAFKEFKYPNGIGPGVYDIHSPRIPSIEEIYSLIQELSKFLPIENIWINPDCGLKTRKWNETIQSLKNMVEAVKLARIYLK